MTLFALVAVLLRRKADDYKALAEEHAGPDLARLETIELIFRELADAITEAERERDAA